MWLLGETLHLDKRLMICEPDAWRGDWMLREVMDGGILDTMLYRMEYGGSGLPVS